MTSLPLLFAISVLGQASSDPTARLVAWGHTAAPGILANYTVGVRPFDPIDPTRPTVVVIHGLNPYHPLMHFTMAQRYAESIGGRYGASVNVVGWDWNAATLPSLRPSVIRQNAVVQGHSLAEALLRAGTQPSGLHLVGQSSGCVTATSAARVMLDRTGQKVSRITMLDPAKWEHPLIFEQLAATSATIQLDNLWVPGASGFGQPVDHPAVTNHRVEGPRGVRGLFNPLRLDHFYAVGWHADQMGR